MAYKSTERNRERANWAGDAIDAFEETTKGERENTICDLLCDLMHWAVQNDFDFDEELRVARENFAVESKGVEEV